MHMPSYSRLVRPKTATRPRTAKKVDAGVSAAMEEEKKDSGTQFNDMDDEEEVKGDDDDLSVIDEEVSDDDNFSFHEGYAPNKVTVGIQTSEIHFRKVGKSSAFQKAQKERQESTDWTLSPLYDDIQFTKSKKTIGGRKLTASTGTQMDKNENCGNQVEQKQILQETCIQILSQIECEYNVDQLKRKHQGTDASEHARLAELYGLGINTLEALMKLLRLEKEWEY